MESYIKNNVSDITYLSELTPPSRWIKICNRFMSNLIAIKHKGYVISIGLEGGVNSSATKLMVDSLI